MTLETSHPHVLFYSCPGSVQKPILRTQDYHMTCVPAVHSLRKPTRVKNNNRKFYFSRTNENISRSNEKFSRSNEKYSRNNEKYSRNNENISRSNEKNSRKNEKLSRRNENIFRRNEN